MGKLVSHSSLLTVTGEKLDVVGELHKHTQTLDNHQHTASLEVGTSDRAAEQSVAREGHLLILDVKHHATHRMSRSLDNLDVVGAEGDVVAHCECLYLHVKRFCERDAEVGCLLVGTLDVGNI